MTVITEDRLPVASGDLVAEKYRVGRMLGLGGMACVVAATHQTLEQKVALKVMLPSFVSHAEAVERFLREGRAAAQLQSHHVCKVLDVGKLETGEPFLVMEYLEGHDLERILTKRGALPVDDAVEIIVQACSALAEAHEKGIVHRDIKPANLFVSPKSDGRPHVKVLDFGISKIDGSAVKGARVTRENIAMGSPAYMSPEQTRSAHDVDHRTDIWALGVLLYRMLAGREPFTGDNVASLFEALLEKPPLPLTDLKGYLPDGLEDIVLRCLEKDPAKRFQSVSDLAGTIAKVSSRSATFSFFPPPSAAGVDSSPGVDSLASMSSANPGSKTATSWGQGVGRQRSTTRRVVAAALLGFAVVGAGGVFIAMRVAGHPQRPAHTPAAEPASPTTLAGANGTPSPSDSAITAPPPTSMSPTASVASVKGRAPTPGARPTTTARPHVAPKPPAAQTFAPVPPAPPPTQATATADGTVEPPRHRTSW